MAPLQFCTTSSRQYLPYARALNESIRRTNSESTLWVLLTDDHHHTVDQASESFRCVWTDELGIEAEELHRLLLIHADVFHIAIKPWIVAYTLNETGGPVMFIDSDIRVHGSLDDLGVLIEEHGVVLSPHLRAPLPLDNKLPDDTTILAAGTFNAGMVGVGEAGRSFIDFWQSRLRRECFVDAANMRVGEQKWLDFVPSVVGCFVLRDPGVNAAYWNLHDRPLSRVADVIMAGERPLRAFHFSGHDVSNPTVISRHMVHRPRFVLEDEPILQALCQEYGAAVLAQRFEESQMISVDFAYLPGGMPITRELREVFRLAVIAAETDGTPYPPDPYDPMGQGVFAEWAEKAFASHGLKMSNAEMTPRPETRATNAELADVVQRLAESSSGALTNLNRRLQIVEQQLAAAM